MCGIGQICETIATNEHKKMHRSLHINCMAEPVPSPLAEPELAIQLERPNRRNGSRWDQVARIAQKTSKRAACIRLQRR